jgi:hypothetical protein
MVIKKIRTKVPGQLNVQALCPGESVVFVGPDKVILLENGLVYITRKIGFFLYELKLIPQRITVCG